MKAQNYLIGLFIHFGIVFASLFLVVPPIRRLAKRLVTQPGGGATKEQAKNDRIEYRAIGHPDVQTKKPGRAFCRAYYEGSLYKCKLLFLGSVEWTMLILRQ